MKKKININSLALNISIRCQRSCERCYGHLNAFSEPAFMDFDTAKKAAEIFFANVTAEAGGDFMFFGGEPLLNWELMEEFIPWFSSLDTPDNIVLFTITNGIDLTPEKIDFHAKYNVRPITVSLDGDFPIHSRVKRVNKEEFDHIIAMIRYGLKIDPSFMIPHCVLKKENISETYDILSYLASLGVKWINLARDLYEDWTEEDRTEAVRQTNKVVAETGVTIQPFAECIFDCTTCYAPSIMVYPNGDIYDSCYCMSSVLRDRGLITEADSQIMYMGNVNSVDGLYIDIEKKREIVRTYMDCHLFDEDIYVAADRIQKDLNMERPYFRVMDIFEKNCTVQE